MEATLKHQTNPIMQSATEFNFAIGQRLLPQNYYVNPRWRLRASHVLLHVFHAVNILFPAILYLLLKDMKELAAVMYPDFNLCSSLSAINLRQNLCCLPWRGEIVASSCSYITYDWIEPQLSNSSGNLLSKLWKVCSSDAMQLKNTVENPRLGSLVSKFKGSEVNLSTTV